MSSHVLILLCTRDCCLLKVYSASDSCYVCTSWVCSHTVVMLFPLSVWEQNACWNVMVWGISPLLLGFNWCPWSSLFNLLPPFFFFFTSCYPILLLETCYIVLGCFHVVKVYGFSFWLSTFCSYTQSWHFLASSCNLFVCLLVFESLVHCFSWKYLVMIMRAQVGWVWKWVNWFFGESLPY